LRRPKKARCDAGEFGSMSRLSKTRKAGTSLVLGPAITSQSKAIRA
jgi:hypothetical protein